MAWHLLAPKIKSYGQVAILTISSDFSSILIRDECFVMFIPRMTSPRLNTMYDNVEINYSSMYTYY